MNKLLQIFKNSDFLNQLLKQLSESMPKLLLAIVILFLAWLFIKMVIYLLKKILKTSKIDLLADKIKKVPFFEGKNINIVPSKIIVKIVYYLLLLICVLFVADFLKLDAVSNGISSFIAYLPILFSALTIFVVGVYIASLVRKAVESTIKSLEISGSKLISSIVFYVIVVFISIMTLNQAGIDTGIITKNILILLGTIFLSFAIAFGLGAKDIMQRLLFGFFSKRNFSVGQYVKTSTLEGVIQNIDNICVKIQTKDGVVVVPIKEFVNQEVVIIDKSNS